MEDRLPLKDVLVIAGRKYSSRLLVGTGKYKDFEETQSSIEASGAEIVTVAIRRTNIGQDSSVPNILDFTRFSASYIYTHTPSANVAFRR